jgi:regulatory protein
VRERALALLTVRARGRAELARALERRGFDRGAVSGALTRLEREGWLDDLAAARSAVVAREGRYGRERIRRELSARGFSEETIAKALSGLEPEAEARALSRVLDRLRRSGVGLSLEKRRRRVRGALLRRGFSAAAISAKMKDWTARDRGVPGRDGDEDES